jgi:hypothetical protein
MEPVRNAPAESAQSTGNCDPECPSDGDPNWGGWRGPLENNSSHLPRTESIHIDIVAKLRKGSLRQLDLARLAVPITGDPQLDSLHASHAQQHGATLIPGPSKPVD